MKKVYICCNMLEKERVYDGESLKPLQRWIVSTFIFVALLANASGATKSGEDLCNSSTRFTCSDGICISKAKVCDDYWDCAYGEDEVDCVKDFSQCYERNKTMANINKYKCRNTCQQYTCKNKKTCVCDDECGSSCIKTNIECPEKLPEVENTIGAVVLRRSFREVAFNFTNNKPYVYGDVVKYQCKEGMTLVGPLPRCTGRGKWSKELPKCVINNFITGVCFLSDYGNETRKTCSQEIGTEVDKASCCCSGLMRSWGISCETCPEKGTKEFKRLCPGGLGFKLNLDTMVFDDIDECEELPGLCQRGICINVCGSYICECPQGHALKRGICEDVDECEIINICGAGTCVNFDRGYVCSCPDGWKPVNGARGCEDTRYGDCFLRVDQDENASVCSRGIGVDVSRETCCCIYEAQGWGDPCEVCPKTNSDEYKAFCKTGDEYKSKQPTVEGIYERKIISNECQRRICDSTNRPIDCICPVGYDLNRESKFCEDIDECEIGVGVCEPGICVNTAGSYVCLCPEGWTPKNHASRCDDDLHPTGTCFLRDEKNETAPICSQVIGKGVTKISCCCSGLPTSWGDPCAICPKIESAEYMALCPGGEGFKPSPITVFIEDVDECQEFIGLCQKGKCTNVYGSFLCECTEGYALNENYRICDDIDECEQDGNVCGPGTCTNSDGGYSCICPDGWKAINNARTCEDKQPKSCFLEFTEEFSINESSCNSPVGGNVTKSTCCCSYHAQAWSSQCEPCPENDTYEYKRLCPDDVLPEEPDDWNVTPSDDIYEYTHNCYLEYQEYNGTEYACNDPVGNFLTSRAECCCSYHAQGWGNQPCESCPKKDMADYTTLCGDDPELDPGNTEDHDAENMAPSYDTDEYVFTCFWKFNDSEYACSEPIEGFINLKSTCCCSYHAQAWGDPCDPCPKEDTVEYIKLCSDELIKTSTDDNDDCKRFPGDCKGGACVNIRGYSECICPGGFSVVTENGTFCENDY